MSVINIMQVSGISFSNNIKTQMAYIKNSNMPKSFVNFGGNLQVDSFQKSSNTKNIISDVSFTGVESCIPNRFETTFSRQFFKKLLRERIPDAYSDRNLIPLEDIDELKKSMILNKKGSIAIKALKPYEKDMFPVEQEVFTILETISKKHPNLTLHDLLRFKYNKADMRFQPSAEAEAFIAKYSQPYKIRVNEFGEEKKKLIDSQEIGIRLLENSVGTDDHIYPKAKYLSNNKIDDAIDFRVTILTSKKLNNEKTDILLDDFIKNGNPEVPIYIQKHVDRLLDVQQKWQTQGKLSDALTLADYIIVLRDEFAKRSDIVRIDIGDIEEKTPKLREKVSAQFEKKNAKQFKK